MAQTRRRNEHVRPPVENKAVAATFPPKFKPFLTEKARWKVVFGGRASGKSESIAKALLLIGQQQPIRILCAREIMQSLRESSHQVLSSLIGVLGLENYYTIENARIFGPWIDSIDFETGQKKKRRTEFMFIGLREMNVAQIKSYFDIQIIWIDEASEVSRKSLRLLGPTLRRAQGSDPDAPNELWVSFNPTRESDAIYQFIKDPPPDSIIIEMNWRDNPWFEQSGLRTEMEHDKRRSYEEYLHTWEGQCLKYWEGQVYVEQMKQADAEGRICEVPYLPEYPCEVSFDIGGGRDVTAYWVWQRVGDFVHLIDYHEKQQSELDYHIKWLENKPYSISKYWLPHDAKQKHAGMALSYEQLVRAKGKKVQIVPSGSGALEEGINALRTLFSRMRFDAKRCARGIECLRNYRYEVETDTKGGLKQSPVHDQYSHGCLTGDAAVLTEHGLKPIADIQAGERVWTPAGYAKVLWSGPVKQVRSLIEITTSDGRSLRCTPEHKIATTRGLINADAVGYIDTALQGRELTCHLIGLFSRVTRIGFRALITGDMCSAARDQRAFIGRFGQMRMDQFQKIITSITSMVIPSTMRSIIFSASRNTTTFQCTPDNSSPKDASKRSENWHVPDQPNGTLPRQDMLGMSNLENDHGQTSRGIRASVRNALARLCRHILKGRSSATSTVKWLHFDADVESQWVYDLTVERHQCYQANGILVSNSDAARYIAMAYRHIQETAYPVHKYNNVNPFRNQPGAWMSL